MKIYDELKKDHEKVKALLDELVVAESTESRRNLIQKITEDLIPHSRAEEAVFYNVLRDIDNADAKEIVGHSYGEHMKAETLLRGLQVTESVAMNWKAGAKQLKEALEHHIKEEEGKLFSAAKKLLSDEEAKAIGEAFVELKPKMGEGVVASTMELIGNLMPERLRPSLDKHFEDTKTKKAS